MAPKQQTLRELALFAGAGGGILGGKLLGWRTVCAVEIEPYCREVLMRRQNEGHLDPFPIWDDVRTFDGRPWNGLVDVVSGGFPCQPYSVAGEHLGEHDARNLWPDTCRIIREAGPAFAWLENVPGLLGFPYFGTILSDLAEGGYDAEWGVFSSGGVGAVHHRPRLWVLAFDPVRVRTQRHRGRGHPGEAGQGGAGRAEHLREALENPCWPGNGVPQPLLRRVDDGFPCRVERLRAIGNAQDPRVCATAWRILSGQ